EEDLADRGGRQAAACDRFESLGGVRYAAAGSAERVGGADHEREFEPTCYGMRFLDRGHDFALGDGLADFIEELLEELAVLGLADGLDGGAEEADVVAFEDASVGERNGEVEA